MIVLKMIKYLIYASSIVLVYCTKTLWLVQNMKMVLIFCLVSLILMIINLLFKGNEKCQ